MNNNDKLVNDYEQEWQNDNINFKSAVPELQRSYNKKKMIIKE